MIDKLIEYDPFHRPSPYDVLELKQGTKASAKEIGRAYNNLKKKARRIKDLKERAARMEALDRAKEQLQRPENRVLFDFFMLGGDLFTDLCDSLGARLAKKDLPTERALRGLLQVGQYDDLLPRPLDQFQKDFDIEQEVQWFSKPYDEEESLTILSMD